MAGRGKKLTRRRMLLEARLPQEAKNETTVVDSDKKHYDVFVGHGSKWYLDNIISNVSIPQDEKAVMYRRWISSNDSLKSEAVTELGGKTIGLPGGESNKWALVLAAVASGKATGGEQIGFKFSGKTGKAAKAEPEEEKKIRPNKRLEAAKRLGVFLKPENTEED